MTAEAGAIDQPQREVSPWRAVGLFVLLTACLSGIFWVLINDTQTPNPGYIWLLMWMPGVGTCCPAASWAGRFAASAGPGTGTGC